MDCLMKYCVTALISSLFDGVLSNDDGARVSAYMSGVKQAAATERRATDEQRRVGNAAAEDRIRGAIAIFSVNLCGSINNPALIYVQLLSTV